MKVYFIGAGPGDPQLLTIKASRIIKKADTIIYAGSLVNKDILKYAKKEAKIYDSSGMTLNEILEVIKKSALQAKTVARIQSGDLSIYSAIQEQIDWCEKENLDYEIIPGISSYQQAAASLKQELTLPGVSQTVILTRISGRTKVPLREDLEKLARSQATMVIFLSIQEIDRLVTKLKKSYGLNTPVAVVERVSLSGARKIIGTLKDIARKVRQAKIKRQALIIVGDVLKKEYQKSKLYDKNFPHSYRSHKQKR